MAGRQDDSSQKPWQWRPVRAQPSSPAQCPAPLPAASVLGGSSQHGAGTAAPKTRQQSYGRRGLVCSGVLSAGAIPTVTGRGTPGQGHLLVPSGTQDSPTEENTHARSPPNSPSLRSAVLRSLPRGKGLFSKDTWALDDSTLNQMTTPDATSVPTKTRWSKLEAPQVSLIFIVLKTLRHFLSAISPANPCFKGGPRLGPAAGLWPGRGQ